MYQTSCSSVRRKRLECESGVDEVGAAVGKQPVTRGIDALLARRSALSRWLSPVPTVVVGLHHSRSCTRSTSISAVMTTHCSQLNRLFPSPAGRFRKHVPLYGDGSPQDPQTLDRRWATGGHRWHVRTGQSPLRDPWSSFVMVAHPKSSQSLSKVAR